MFDYFDLKDALKSHINYLTPGEAPYYFIIIGLEIFLFKAAHELTGQPWFYATLAGSVFLTACLLSALAQKWENDSSTEKAHMRVGRVVGIAVPLIALAVTMSKTKHSPALMIGAIAITFGQVAAFLFLVRERKLEASKSINIPQLLIICSSLMFSLHFAISSMSGRLYLSKLPESLIVSAGEKPRDLVPNASRPASGPTAKERQSANAIYRQIRTAQSILDEESAFPLIPANTIAIDVVLGGKGMAVSELAFETANNQLANLRVLVAFFLAAWFIVISRTIFYALTKQ